MESKRRLVGIESDPVLGGRRVVGSEGGDDVGVRSEVGMLSGNCFFSSS